MSETTQIAALESRLAELEQRLTVREDELDIRKLQHLYGYLIDKCLYNETVDLFTDDGFLLDHPQLQDIINVQPDGVTAYGRARSMMQAGRHKDYEGDAPHLKARQWWEGGIYENTYKKVDGVWRMHSLNYMPIWHGHYESGWAHTPPEFVPFPKVTYPEDPTGPDVLIEDNWLWPTHKITPFHMKHPVTGEEIVAERWQGDIDRENANK
ncbi:MAG: nuclear transport factor 2 family protein [Pseudomonadota bacterium]